MINRAESSSRIKVIFNAFKDAGYQFYRIYLGEVKRLKAALKARKGPANAPQTPKPGQAACLAGFSF